VKNLSLILNALLIIAVGFLYYDEFKGNDDDHSEAIENEEANTGDLTIAYVNSDTLLARYKYYEEVSNNLDKKREKLQKEYTRRAEGWQKQVEDYQRTAGNLTIAQARAVEEDLGKKQQNLMQYQETIKQELLQSQAEMMQELYDKVADYLKIYAKENNLKLVLTYSSGSNILYANEGLDITETVISALNDLHENGAGQTNDSDSTASK